MRNGADAVPAGMGLWQINPTSAILIGQSPRGRGLQEETEFRGISAEQLAELCDEAVENIKQVFKGSREITPDLAESLERILGIKAYIWLGLEENYQETLERIGEVRPS